MVKRKAGGDEEERMRFENEIFDNSKSMQARLCKPIEFGFYLSLCIIACNTLLCSKRNWTVMILF
jgi:hypothetical protein